MGLDCTGPVKVGRDVTREELMDIWALEEGVFGASGVG